jgi:hypothetical protein
MFELPEDSIDLFSEFSNVIDLDRQSNLNKNNDLSILLIILIVVKITANFQEVQLPYYFKKKSPLPYSQPTK